MNLKTPRRARILRITLGVALSLVFAGGALAADLAILRNGFTIRHDHRTVMGSTTRLFLSADGSSFTDVATADIESFEKEPPPPATPPNLQANFGAAMLNPRPSVLNRTSPADLNQVVNSASANYHLDPDLVNSVIRAESGFKSNAVSNKGAQGLMQLMPKTAGELGVGNAFDPKSNVDGGSHYLRELLERYNFDLVKALAAYNAGPERVEKYQGVPPFHETRAYVASIIRDYNKKKLAQERGAVVGHPQSRSASVGAAGSKSTAQSTPRARRPNSANAKSSAQPPQ